MQFVSKNYSPVIGIMYLGAHNLTKSGTQQNIEDFQKHDFCPRHNTLMLSEISIADNEFQSIFHLKTC